ncbi:hypothetical protein [Kutzneria kofuensis]|uniref:hypothetical protein n=1 Tax=Kutzneria kofuensis TaxID=103725 RepID=UPI00161B6D9B|nr:hypothetical protein [Kutzneria kofuensis]
MSLGGVLIYDIDASLNSDCRLEAFGVGTNHEMYHIWQDANASNGWSGWASLGGYLTSRPWSHRLSDNRLEVCAWGPDHIYHCKAQTRPSSGPWTDWY